MKYRVGCELEYLVRERATFIFSVAVRASSGQRIVEEQYALTPELKYEEFATPPEGNRSLRVAVAPGAWRLTYRAVVEKSPVAEEEGVISEAPIESLPAAILPYVYPSRYCQSDKLARYAQKEFGGIQPGLARVMAVCNWIYENVEYLRGSSDQSTSAFDTATERAGVCRDFAHLGIAFCRALGVPARFVSAYAYQLNPPDFHACFEAYLEDKWYVFDATRLAPPTGFIRIGTGRDAADIPFASIFGAAEMTGMSVHIEPAAATPAAELPQFTAAAITLP